MGGECECSTNLGGATIGGNGEQAGGKRGDATICRDKTVANLE